MEKIEAVGVNILMSRQRYIETCFWDDSYVIHLDPSEKLLFIYLLTNPLTTICGIYEISLKRISFDTGFEHDTVKRILGRFERDERCLYRDGWLAMRNWIKHQKDAPGVQRGIALQLEKVPQDLAQYVRGSLTGVEPPLDPHINVNDNTNTNTKPMPKFSFTLEDGFIGISYEDLQRWADTYPAVNIAGEIKKAAEWLRSNPSKRKSNYRRFLTNWFSRTQERGGTPGYKPAAARPATPQLAQPQPLSEAERKENLKALDDLQRRLAKDKRLSEVGGEKR
jgi:hypothetical protein